MSENIQVPTEVDSAAEIKQLHDINLQALAADLAQVLSNHVGGEFDVTLTKLEHTKPGFVGDKIILNFLVEDESHMERYSLSKKGRRFESLRTFSPLSS
jgi:hypothetical protein